MDEQKTTMKPGTSPLDGKALKTWRDRMGYDPADAAAALGVTHQKWTHWESGLHGVPRYVGLAMAALAMGISPYGEEPVDANPTGE